MRVIINCHCSECLKFHGNFAPYTQIKKHALSICGEDNITWFYTDKARRGFCKHCGSCLFWDLLTDDYLDIAAGALDKPTGLTTAANIFTADKSDFYNLPDVKKNYPGSMKK